MTKYLALVCLCLSVSVGIFASDKFVVVIDPGHGGRDGGAARKTMKEKDINLAVALQLGSLIEANISDAKVVYTRRSDVFVDLNKRAEIANKAKANLFISIHTNSTEATVTKALGADTYILGTSRTEENLRVAKRENSVILLEDDYTKKYEGFDPSSPESNILFEFMVNKYMEQSLDFANSIQKNFKTLAKRTDRGVRQAGFLVLRSTSMPSVLIELGFINNPTEAKYLTSKSGQRVLANSIYSAFKSYKADFDRKRGVSSSLQDEQQRPVVIEQEKPKLVASDAVGEKDPKKVSESISSKPVALGEKSSRPQARTETKGEQSKKLAQDEVEYKIQFLLSAKELPQSSSQFKGLSPVSYYREGATYKYTYGSTTSVNESIKLQREVRKKFPDAFVVKFKNGEKF